MTDDLTTADRRPPTDDVLASTRRLRWAVGALAVLAAALTTLASRSGIGMTTDSVAYAFAARAVAAGEPPTTMTGHLLAQFPPGLPVLLGTIARAWPGGADVTTVAAALGALLAGGLVVVTYALAASALRDRRLALVPTALTAVATSTTMLYSRMWSEPLACVLTTVVLLLLTRAVVAARLSGPTFAAVVVLVMLTPWVRYVGLGLIPVAGVGAALALRRHGPVRAVAAGIAVASAGALGSVALVLRNLAAGAGLFGPHGAPQGSVADYLADTTTTLGALVLPAPVADRWPALAVAVGLVVAVLLAYGTVVAVRDRDAAMAVLLLFVATYWLTVLLAGRVSFVEFMRYRMAAPALVPLAILATYSARHALRRTEYGPTCFRRGLLAAVAMLAVLAGPVALAQSAGYAWTVGRHGHGYADAAVIDSAVSRAVVALPSSAVVVSNDPAAVYWATGRVVGPYRTGEVPLEPGTFIAAFDHAVPGVTRSPIDPAADGVPVDVVLTAPDGRLLVVAAR